MHYKSYNEETDRIDLDPSYLMSVTFSDGFSFRLRNAEILIDRNYNLKLDLSCHSVFEGDEQIADNFEINLNINQLPVQLKRHFDTIFTKKIESLKGEYPEKDYLATDLPENIYLINTSNMTKNIHIEDVAVPRRENCTSQIEYDFLMFDQYLSRWVDQLGTLLIDGKLIELTE